MKLYRVCGIIMIIIIRNIYIALYGEQSALHETMTTKEKRNKQTRMGGEKEMS